MKLLFALLLSGRFVAAAIQAITLTLLARALDPTSFATVAAALGVAVFTSAFTDLGVTPASTRETVRDPSNLRGLRRLNSEVAALVSLPLFAAVVITGWATRSSLVLSLAPLALWLVAERLAEFRFAVLVGLNSGFAASVSVVIRKAVPMLAVALSFLLPALDPVLALTAGYVVGSAVSWVVGSRRVKAAVSGHLNETISRAKAFRISSPFWLNSLSAQARQLDVVIVALLAGPVSAAVYAPAARLMSPLLIVPSTLAQAAMPAVARDPFNTRVVGRLFVVGLLPTSAIYAVGIALAPHIVPFLLGAQYSSSVTSLQVLMVGLIAAGGGALATTVLQAQGRERLVAVVNVNWSFAALLLIAGGSLLGPLGAAGAVCVGFGGQATTLIVLLLRSRRSSQP